MYFVISNKMACLVTKVEVVYVYIHPAVEAFKRKSRHGLQTNGLGLLAICYLKQLHH